MTKIIFFGDNDTTADAVKVLDAIKKEQNVDQYVFLGDGPYNKTGTKWVGMMKPFFPDTSKLILIQGNHDDEESESEKTQQDIEAWIPSLKDSPAKGGDQSWENPTWLHSKQIGDIYLIGMNSQDMDVEFKRNQYNWVIKQLGTIVSLRQQGKINWAINAVHKPWFTLKSSHSPYTAVREIYSEPFHKTSIDQNWHGHNHNDQAWFPMIAIMQDGNAAGKPLYELAADKKTLDHSKPHGWTTNINGHSGHEHNPFKEKPTANKNVMWGNDSVFSYAVVESNPSTKILNTKWKDVSGKVLFEYNITRAGVTNNTPPQPQPNPGDAPTSPPPGPGYKWDSAQKKWVPKLEDPAFIPDHEDPEPDKPKPDPVPIPSQGQVDQMGIAWLIAKGKQTMVKQSRDTADDDRWSTNVPGCELGFEATMIAKSTGVASDGHFAMKQGGSNHSKGDWKNERWLDTGIRSDGTIQLQWEGPHPKNHDFTLPDGKLLIKNIGVKLDGNWIGLKWAQIKLEGAQGSPANGGVRWMMWVNTNIAQDGKPDNSKWRMVYDFIDGKDVKVIQPQDHVMKGTMDVEVRRSGTKQHSVYGGGLFVRTLQ